VLLPIWFPFGAFQRVAGAEELFKVGWGIRRSEIAVVLRAVGGRRPWATQRSTMSSASQCARWWTQSKRLAHTRFLGTVATIAAHASPVEFTCTGCRPGRPPGYARCWSWN